MRGNSTALLGNKELAKEVAALKAQLKSLTETLEAEIADGGSAARKLEDKGKEAINQAMTTAESFIEDQAGNVRDVARALARKSSEVRDAATQSLVETVQARPLGTLAAIIGIGFLAGYLCRRH